MTTTQTIMTVDAIFRARSAAATAQVMNHMERHARLVFMLLDGRRPSAILVGRDEGVGR